MHTEMDYAYPFFVTRHAFYLDRFQLAGCDYRFSFAV